ncbi:hypothetical protein GIB67_028362 [Kingdonia uniflora]|uniref:Actin-related protein 5 n=1 Tax=Kingdonia uniflora TaxID=39325 RepID=A0A7J7MI58_9MAGN|nr:hypothetical protein GIB67_028362 [Kingdonia uniflora]
MVRVTQSLRKAKGELPEMKEKTEQLGRSKGRHFLRICPRGGCETSRKGLKKSPKEKQNRQDEEKRSENPKLYLEQIRAKHRELNEKHLREDTFRARDEDWQVYTVMGGNDDEESDWDEAELTRISLDYSIKWGRLIVENGAQYDINPTFVANPEAGVFQTITEIPKFCPLIEEDFQITIEVKRLCCPKVFLQPSMIGVDQAGLNEMCGISIRRLSSKNHTLEERMTSLFLMTGGSCHFPGMAKHLEIEIIKICHFGASIQCVELLIPFLMLGGELLRMPAAPQFSMQSFSKQDYYEKGKDWLWGYCFSYT